MKMKTRRLSEIISFQQEISYKTNQSLIGKIVEIMIDGRSKKSDLQLSGRTDTNKTVIFPGETIFPGEAAKVKIDRASSATLFGQKLFKISA